MISIPVLYGMAKETGWDVEQPRFYVSYKETYV